MSTVPDITYLDAARNEGQMKNSFFGPILDVLAELPGGKESIPELTISSGSITPTAAIHRVDTEGDGSSDDLANIVTTNHPEGRLLILFAEDDSRTVTVKHESGGAGQMHLVDNADFSLDDSERFLVFVRYGADWYEVLRNYRKAASSEYGVVQMVDEDDMASDSDTKVPTQQSVKAYVDDNAGGDLPYGYKKGLELVNDTDTDHDIEVQVGAARDHSDTYNLVLSSAMAKQIDASWAAGDDAGGLFAGSVAADTWYHVFLIEKDSDGSIDAGFDTSFTAANIPSGYTAYRWIGAVLTDASANILGFTQCGNRFLWDDPSQDVNVSNQGTSVVSRTLSVPPDIKVAALLTVGIYYTADRYLYVRSPDAGDEAPSISLSNICAADGGNNGGAATGMLSVLTNTSKQVTTRASGVNTDVDITTLGYDVINWEV